MELTGYKLKFKLNPQSPMIHFQHDQLGATLRVSEVKPKLDKFLSRKRNSTIPAKWKIDEQKNALDYKMHITIRKASEVIAPHKIFYGNMHNKWDTNFKEKKAVISYPNVEILCFDNELLHFIRENIWEFFVVTNFGTMQNKGFGSFMVDDEEKNESDIIRALKENGVEAVYKMDFGSSNDFGSNKLNRSTLDKMFNQIREFYSVMKSGVNYDNSKQNPNAYPHGFYAHSFLAKYMKGKFQIDNEKAWMKEKKISPNVITSPNAEYKRNNPQTNPNPRYVRAMFGKGDTVSYFKDEKLLRKDKVTVAIKPKPHDNDLARIPSNVHFKIIGNCVYILGKKVNERIYDKSFEFVGDESMYLSTPSRSDFAKCGNEFPIEDFLDNYMKYYNGELRDKDLKKVRSYQRVEKC